MSAWVPENHINFHWGDVFVCEPDWSWSVTDLPDLDIWYVAEGVGWIDAGEQRTPIGAGDCLLLRIGGSYESGHDPERPLTLLCVHFDLVGEDGYALSVPQDESRPFARRMGDGAFFRNLLMSAIRCHQDGRRAHAAAWLQTALLEVAREDEQRWPPGPAGKQARRIQQICERIRRQPGHTVRISSLASELSLSPEHFCRVFAQLQGVPPRTFISRTRMDAARALLLTSSYSVARIAERLGYHSPSHFTRHFKSAVGLSPSKFRLGERRHGRSDVRTA